MPGTLLPNKESNLKVHPLIPCDLHKVWNKKRDCATKEQSPNSQCYRKIRRYEIPETADPGIQNHQQHDSGLLFFPVSAEFS